MPDDFLRLICDEVNVKVVRPDQKGINVVLDTQLTDELREEGAVRDTIREIQAYRKENGLKPGQNTTYHADFSAEQRAIVEKNLDSIQKATHTTIQFK